MSRYLKFEKEKQQINFLNCNNIDKWIDTCQVRKGEFVAVVDEADVPDSERS